jgi:ADP-heptose:LPS heptosyltransferase
VIARARHIRRRANRRFYRCLFRLYRALFPTPTWRGPLDPRSIRRILVVRDDRIGDMVVTIPLLSFLRETVPHADIDVLASPANAAIAAFHPGVTTIFVNDRTWVGWFRVLRRLRSRRYDLVFSPVARKALRESLVASMIAHRHTYKISGWRPVRYQGLVTAVTRVPPRLTHIAERTLYIGQHAFGVRQALADTRRYPMRLEIDASTGTRASAFLSAHGIEQFAAVNLIAGGARRDWRPDVCAAFVTLVLDRHPELSVVLTCPPGAEDRVADVRQRVANGRLVATPVFALPDLIALLKRAVIVVTPETALIHIASACGRPVVAIYGPQHPNDVPLWLPLGVPYRALASKLGGSLNDVDAAHVAAAFDELWDEARERHAAPVPPSR